MLESQNLTDSVQMYIRAQKFYFLAEQCLNLIQKSMQPILKELGLNHSQHLVLLILWYSDISENEIISTEIAYLLGLEKHSVSTIIDNLHKRHLIRRQRNSKDRRAVQLNLTDKGRALVNAHLPRTIEMVSFKPESANNDYSFLFSFMESLRDTAAEKIRQDPAIYANAFRKLLLDGQEKYLEMCNEEKNDA